MKRWFLSVLIILLIPFSAEALRTGKRKQRMLSTAPVQRPL